MTFLIESKVQSLWYLKMNSSFSLKLLSALIWHPCTRMKTFVQEKHLDPNPLFSIIQLTLHFCRELKVTGTFPTDLLPATVIRYWWMNRNIKPKIKDCQRYNGRDGCFLSFLLPDPFYLDKHPACGRTEPNSLVALG